MTTNWEESLTSCPLKVDPSWYPILEPKINSKEFNRDMLELRKNIKKLKIPIYPPKDQVFNAFKLTPFKDIKVIILGQDPYHGLNQAHGLAFSVPDGIPIPPSLINIFKEANIINRANGDLTNWAKQGVFLLNSALTVPDGCAGFHLNYWQRFTDYIIQQISEHKEHVVFILWGNFARSKSQFIDNNKHLILQSAHPSPLSASRGFFGNKHFEKANEFLVQYGIEPINWE